MSSLEEKALPSGGIDAMTKAIEVIQCQIDLLRSAATAPLAIHLLEMASLELSIAVNGISAEELDRFCGHIREFRSQNARASHV